MAARFPDVLVVIGGQSQAIMALTGGGETVDDPMIGRPVAAERLRALLAAWMPGVTISVAGASTGATYTARADTPLLRSLHTAAAFWDDTAGPPGFDVHGLATRDFILARAGATRLCVYVHWSQSQDAASSAWTNTGYATGLAAYYDALHAACAPAFGEFRIVKLVAGSRSDPGGVAERLDAMRAIAEALGGAGPAVHGATRRGFVMPPTHSIPKTPRGAYVQGSSDFAHDIRSAAWRFAGHVAAVIACQNGFVPPVQVPPRLAFARLITPATLRAFFVSPARLPLVRQGTGGFRLSSGTITGEGAVNNAQVSASGYATIDLAVSGVVPGARLFWLSRMDGYSGFVNGTTPPRGQLSRALWANPGSVPAITDQAEDLAGSDVALFADATSAGVPIDP